MHHAEAMAWKTDLKARVFTFVTTVLKLYPQLSRVGPPYAHIAMQLFRSASGIGSNLEEGDVAASRRDMGWKQAISLREAKESRYWVRILIADGTMVEVLRPLLAECEEFVAMLTVSVRKLRSKPPKPGRLDS